MILSPAGPMALMGGAFGATVRSFRGPDPSGSPTSASDLASLRLLVEEVTACGASAFDAILRFDSNWRTSVFRGEIEHDEATETLIRDNIRGWVENGRAFVAVVDSLEARGIKLPDVEPIRTRIVSGRDMLTPDDEFFEGEGLDELTARAIDE